MLWKGKASGSKRYNSVINVHLKPGLAFLLVAVAWAAALLFISRDDTDRSAAQLQQPSRTQGRSRGHRKHLAAIASRLEERIRVLRKLETSLKTASINQISSLYQQMHAKVLTSFGLNEVETDIALNIVLGESNAGIAKQMHLSESTIKHHISAILKKARVTSRQDLRKKVKSMLGLGQTS